jgi:hypothetical protein
MKKLLFLGILAGSLATCKSTDKKAEKPAMAMTKEEMTKLASDSTKMTSIQWIDSTTRSLGVLEQGKEVEVTFRFKNTGDNLLIVENVSASCGCTIPEKPEQPFAPGEEGIIKAKFNGSGEGVISKHVTVIANTKPVKEHSLTFTGDVQKKK